MKRVCCIGTSHVGALKGGWDLIAPVWPEVAITFFAAPNLRDNVESLSHLTLEGRHIVSTNIDVEKYFHLTSGGFTRIDLDAYDAFIVMSGVGLNKPFELYTVYRTDEQSHADSNVLLSPPCLVDTLAGLFRETFGYRLTTALVHLTGKPVFLAPEPRPSEALLAASGSTRPIWNFYIQLIKQMFANGDHLPEAHYYVTALTAIRQQGVIIVDAPSTMVAHGLFTPHAFSRDSFWLQNGRYEPSPREDFFHMNHDYGAGILSEILARAAA